MSTAWASMGGDELEGMAARAHTVEGTVVEGRLVRVVGPLDQMMFDGVFQPLLIRLPRERWRLAGGWRDLTILGPEA